MADELEAVLVHVAEGAEGLVRAFVLGAGVDQRTLRAGERQLFGVAFEQILANLRADAFDQVTDIAQDRVVAPHRMARLQQIADADQAEHAREQGERPQPFVKREKGQAGQSEKNAEGKEGVAAEQRQVHAGSGI